jgi:4-diphosphocytidyl-2-C-methyl-D-erythritol kinase
MASITLPCPPKLNLFLRVVGKRADGFHDLETVFQSISGGDTLRVDCANDLTLECSDPALPTDQRNLVIRAAGLVRREFPAAANRGASIRLEKRTPMQAGMGGGSVDGAAALVALARLWGIGASTNALTRLAAELGSDVPFFLTGGSALATGRGEILEPWPTPPLWFVVVMPDAQVSTPWAFGQWRPSESQGPSLEAFQAAWASGDPGQISAHLRNDLEPAVLRHHPEIGAARMWLLENGMLGAQMTGSGAAVFGVARDRAHAEAVATAQAPPGTVWSARALNREEADLDIP